MPFYFFFFVFLSFFSSFSSFSLKLKEGLKIRRKKAKFKEDFTSLKPLVWFHASSGEFEYAKPLIRLFKQKYPYYKVLLTYFSPSYEKAVQSFKWVDISQALPMDFPRKMQSFVEKFKPKALLIAKTDLWPEMLYQCKRKKVSVFLFSATCFSSSGFLLKLGKIQSKNFLKKMVLKTFYFLFSVFKKYSPHQLLLKLYHLWVYSFLDRTFCVSLEDQNLFLKRNFLSDKKSVIVAGDTRYDQVFERLKKSNPLIDAFQNFKTPLFIAGSTWPEDEKVLIKALHSLIKEGRLRLVLAPHEPNEGAFHFLNQLLEKYQLKSLFYSQFKKGFHWKKSEVLIFNTMGLLADLYSIGSLAFVGGSFRRSVHSVMEPLAAGLMTFVGPYHRKNREALEFQNFFFSKKSLGKKEFVDEQKKKAKKFLSQKGVNFYEKPFFQSKPFVVPILNAKELTSFMDHYLKRFDLEKLRFQKQVISNELKKRTGASFKILSFLEKDLHLK